MFLFCECGARSIILSIKLHEVHGDRDDLNRDTDLVETQRCQLQIFIFF